MYPTPRHTCFSPGAPQGCGLNTAQLASTEGFQHMLRSGIALVNAISYEKAEIITGGSYLKLRVWGLEIAGKMAAFVQKTEPVLLSTVVRKHPRREDGLEPRRGNETKAESFQSLKTTPHFVARHRRADLEDAQRPSVSVSSSVAWAIRWPPLTDQTRCCGWRAPWCCDTNFTLFFKRR